MICISVLPFLGLPLCQLQQRGAKIVPMMNYAMYLYKYIFKSAFCFVFDGLDSGLCICKADTVLLEPYLQAYTNISLNILSNIWKRRQ
jgi:hypothetical protein